MDHDAKIHKDIDRDLLRVLLDMGYYDKLKKELILDEQYKLCLRDLNRLLRTDSQTNKWKIRRDLGRVNVIGTKFLPILRMHGDEDDVFDLVLRLTMTLTNPTLLMFEEKKPEDKETNQLYIEMTMNLYNAKLLFGRSLTFWNAIAKYMSKILDKESEDRQVEETLMLERILVLIRNVVHIPSEPSLENAASGEANPQDQVIEMMSEAGVLANLLRLLENEEDSSNFCLYLLEIFSHAFRDQSAEYIANFCKNVGTAVRGTKSEYEKKMDKEQFDQIARREKAKSASLVYYQNRFKGATYQIKNVKGLGENDMIIHKTPATLENISISDSKQSKRKPKNHRALKDDKFVADTDTIAFHKSSSSVLKILGDFSNRFLESYNMFMANVRGKIERNAVQDNDQTFYLWAFQFFMEFNRNSKKDISRVAETMSIATFHQVTTLITEYLDRLKMEKSPSGFILWSRRFHFGIKAYRELLYTIHFASNSNKFSDYDIAKSIKAKVFDEEEYREMLLILIRDFNEKKMTQAVLRDLVETNHIFLNMLQKFCLTNNIVVGTKMKKKKGRKPRNASKNKEAKVTEEFWEEVCSDLNEALEGRVALPSAEEDEDVLPMDATVDFEAQLQKEALIKRIRRLVLQKEAAKALALFRNAREAWSDDQLKTFGEENATPEQERDALRQIYFSGIPCDDAGEENNENVEPEESLVEQEPEKEVIRINFDFKDFVKRYCSPKVIVPFYSLFKQYDKNTPVTNKCVIKMFHRIAVDVGLHGMFFQACVFRVFQRILQEKGDPYPELSRFAKFIVSKFLHTMQKNDKLLPELLFWKRAVEAIQLEEGFQDKPTAHDDFVQQYDSDLDNDNEFDKVKAAILEDGLPEKDHSDDSDKEPDDAAEDVAQERNEIAAVDELVDKLHTRKKRTPAFLDDDEDSDADSINVDANKEADTRDQDGGQETGESNENEKEADDDDEDVVTVRRKKKIAAVIDDDDDESNKEAPVSDKNEPEHISQEMPIVEDESSKDKPVEPSSEGGIDFDYDHIRRTIPELFDDVNGLFLQ